MPGDFTYPEKAKQAKIFLRNTQNTSQEDIDLCKRFVDRKEGTSSECNNINRIIKESIQKLRENDFLSDKGQIVLFEYIVINTTMTNTAGIIKSRKSKKSRRNKKSKRNKRSKRKKRSRKNKKSIKIKNK